MDAELLAAWGAEWVITGYEIDVDGLSLADEIDGLFFYENDFFTDDFQLNWIGPNSFNDGTDMTGAPSLGRPGEFLVSDAANWSIADSAGTFHYLTPGLPPGLLISVLTIFLAIGGSVLRA